MTVMQMNSDFKDLLHIFAEHEVEYLIVGAYAVNHYTQPRYTKDLDLWINPTKMNARRVAAAFAQFGIPMVEITQEDLATPGTQLAVGMPPSMLDFLTSLPGLDSFKECWLDRTTEALDSFDVHYLSKSALIAAKKNAARAQDLADIEELNRSL